jgi:hypothetical protein
MIPRTAPRSRLLRLGLALAAVAAFASPPATPRVDASSHSEAPGTSQDRAIDGTDVYAFTSPDAPTTVTLVANYFPLEEPAGGPNYFGFADDALYEIHVDNDGDAKEDITFQYQFTTVTKNPNTFLYNVGPVTYDAMGDTYTNLNVEQRYTLTRVVGDRRTGAKTVLASNVLVAPNNVGPKTFPGVVYDTSIAPAAIKSIAGGIKSFCGPRDDPFFVFLGRVFDLVNIDPVVPGGKDSQCGAVAGGDHLAGYNCHSLVLQVPKAMLTSDASPATDPNAAASIIGVWSTASRRQVKLNRTDGKAPIQGGAWTQMSRLGMPLVNEVVIARADKDKWNYSEPGDDGQFLSQVQNSELAGILNALFPSIVVPPAPRNDLVTVFLTGVPGVNAKGTACEYLRLNMATPVSASPNRMGLLAGQNDGFPNGRRLTDDVVDIALQVVAGHLVGGAFSCAPIGNSPRSLGDTVCANDKPFLASFPYLASPHNGVTRVH